eukprot:329478-Prymnesium_polylepis.1
MRSRPACRSRRRRPPAPPHRAPTPPPCEAGKSVAASVRVRPVACAVQAATNSVGSAAEEAIKCQGLLSARSQ